MILFNVYAGLSDFSRRLKVLLRFSSSANRATAAIPAHNKNSIATDAPRSGRIVHRESIA